MAKILVAYILLLISCNHQAIDQNKVQNTGQHAIKSINNLWTYKGSNYTINLNFESEKFRVDTLTDIEGPIFYIHTYNDSGYFRFNVVSPESKFECCEKYNANLETQKKYDVGITDRSGSIQRQGSNLYWREVRYNELEVIYNECPISKLDFFNKIMDNCKKGFEQKL